MWETPTNPLVSIIANGQTIALSNTVSANSEFILSRRSNEKSAEGSGSCVARIRSIDLCNGNRRKHTGDSGWLGRQRNRPGIGNAAHVPRPPQINIAKNCCTFYFRGNHMKKAQTALGILLLVAGASTVAMAVTVATPEIPAGSAGSAIALVSGMLLMFRGRRK
jgi:hypothetical protein